MAEWIEELAGAWEQRKGPVVFGTVDPAAMPNVIYVSWVKQFGDALLLADNYFDKTKANIDSGSRGAVVFLTAEGRSYQVKGRLERLTSGPAFDEMKTWLPDPEKFPGHAAVLLHVEEAYSNRYGSTRIQ